MLHCSGLSAQLALGCLGSAAQDSKSSRVWWLLIRYSHSASRPGENSSGLHSLSLIIPVSYSLLLFHQQALTKIWQNTVYYVGYRHRFALYFSLSSTPQTFHSCFCLSEIMTPTPPDSVSLLFPLVLSFPLCQSLIFTPLSYSKNVTLVISLWDTASTVDVITTRWGSVEALRTCVSSLIMLMYADETVHMNQVFPLGGRSKHSWPGIHLNCSVTPAAKCWMRSNSKE